MNSDVSTKLYIPVFNYVALCLALCLGLAVRAGAAPAHTNPMNNDPEVREAFDRVATCKAIQDMFDARFDKGWRLDVLNGMNEARTRSPAAGSLAAALWVRQGGICDLGSRGRNL